MYLYDPMHIISNKEQLFNGSMRYQARGYLENKNVKGLIIGTSLGILCATILYFFSLIQKIIDPFLTTLNALPKTALGPLIIIILGTSYKGIIGVCISLNLIITIISWFLLTSTLNMALGKFTSRLYKGIKLISALSLEAYLCQTWVITDRLNHLFPFNLALIFIGILLVSYMLKIISNLFLQTFSERDYDFKRLIKIT